MWWGCGGGPWKLWREGGGGGMCVGGEDSGDAVGEGRGGG